MAKPVCAVCSHAERQGIDSALACGESTRVVASRFGVSQSGVARHKLHGAKGRKVESTRRAPAPPRPSTDARARSARRVDPPQRHRTTPGQLDDALIAEQVVELRRDFKTYREISAVVGRSPKACQRLVEGVIVEAKAAAAVDVAVVRALELDRLEQIQGALYPRATDSSRSISVDPLGEAVYSPAQDKAALGYLKAAERKHAILGINAPAPTTNVTVVNSPAFQEPMRAVFDALAAHPEAEQAVLAALREYRASRATPKLVAG